MKNNYNIFIYLKIIKIEIELILNNPNKIFSAPIWATNNETRLVYGQHGANVCQNVARKAEPELKLLQFLEYFTLVEADDNVEATANEEDNSDVDVYVDGAGLNALLVIERAELRPGFRVLFSLHFSCITSMAIVYVNFDVSAKVVKCEVLDVLIALCCCVLRAPNCELTVVRVGVGIQESKLPR